MYRVASPLMIASLLCGLGAGCPREAPSSSLPPAGLAGAPGGQPPAPSVHMGVAPAGAQAAAGQHPWAAAGGAHAPSGGPAGMPAGHPSVAGTGSAALPGAATAGFGDVPLPGAEGRPELEGVVVEARDVKEYTYVLVKRDDGTQDWAAVIQTALSAGQRVKVSKEIWMSDFQSPSLGRTFDRILFGRLLP